MISFPKISALLLSLFWATVEADNSNRYGLVGPQNVVLYLNGFHFISGEPDHYIAANHHCVFMSSDFLQCAIYVPNTNPARLAGIEYIISAAAFGNLSMEERQLWHSHRYEVTSGYLVEPGTPPTVDDAAMRILVNSYGKTVHTWRYDQKNNSLPLGIPELVSGYTGNGQLPGDFVEERDEFWGINTTEIKESRKEIKGDDIIEGADSWKYGYILTLGLLNRTQETNFTLKDGLYSQ